MSETVSHQAANTTSSLTDVPTQYAIDVQDRRIVAGPLVRAACRRHLGDLEHGHLRGLVWDPVKRDRALAFFPRVLKLNGGKHEGLPFHLSTWQAFVIGSGFGWMNEDGWRRFRTLYIEVGKGNGKSPMAAGIGMYCLMADGEQRAEVYAAASKKDQAMVLFRDAVAMWSQSPDIHSRLQPTGGRNIYNLFYAPTNSFFRAISSDDGQSGPRPHCSLVDEVHEHPNADVVDMLRAGQKGRLQPLSVEITNSGFDRSTVCYAHHAYSEAIVNGSEHNDEWFAYVCGLDKEDDPFKDESCWPKANPNIGVSIDLSYLRGQVREGIGMPSKASKVKRLNFCEWVGAENPWIDGPKWISCEVKFDLVERMNQFDEVVGAIDLSGTRDFTALTLAGKDEIPGLEPMITTATEFWTPADTLDDRAREDKKDYRDWVERGYVTATPGENVNYRWVAQRLIELQTLIPSFRRIAFDPYRIKYLADVLNELNAEFELVPHPQGYYKADDEKVAEHNRKLKHGEKPRAMMWMPRSVELLEAAVISGRFFFNESPALTDNSASAVLVPDQKGNRIFDKRKSRGRIDGMLSTTMVVGFLHDEPPKPKKPTYKIYAIG